MEYIQEYYKDNLSNFINYICVHKNWNKENIYDLFSNGFILNKQLDIQTNIRMDDFCNAYTPKNVRCSRRKSFNNYCGLHKKKNQEEENVYPSTLLFYLYIPNNNSILSYYEL